MLFIASSVGLVVALLLITRYGLYGAAVALLVSALFITLGNGVILHKALRHQAASIRVGTSSAEAQMLMRELS